MLGTELFEICEQLQRDASGRKVLVFDADGAVLAHAGDPGALDDDAGADSLATLVGDVITGAQAGQFPANEDLVATLPRGLQVCAAPVGTQGVLVVVFEKAASLDRVRAKMRRARAMLEKSLPTESGPTAS